MELTDGEYALCSVLPPEIDLARKFDVSRNIIRAGLTRLEQEGYITRKQGVGTLINRDVLNIPVRFDLNYGLMQAIVRNGAAASVAFAKHELVPAVPHIAERLRIGKGELLLRSAQLMCADGKPAIYCIDYIPAAIIAPGTDLDKALAEGDIFDFLRDCCGNRLLETCLSEMHVVPPTEEVAEALKVPRACGLLVLEEVNYDVRTEPMMYSEEYFIEGAVRQVIVRKKL